MRVHAGEQLGEHWADGPSSYLGMATTGFPNLFMILGPNGPFTNLPPAIETQVEWIASTIEHARSTGKAWLEVKPDVAVAHYHLGRALASAGANATAKTHLQQFIEMAPNHPDAKAAKQMMAAL